MTSEAEVIAVLKEIEGLRTRAETAGYVALANELGATNNRVRKLLLEVPIDAAAQLMKAFYPLVFSGMIELSKSDAAIQEKLRKVEDVTYVLKVEEVGFALCLMIKNGEFGYLFGEPAQVDVTMKTTPEGLVEIMSGKTDAIEAFMAGKVRAEGQLSKARSLRAVFESLGDRFGFRIMEFSI